jgi:hypothetical protein
MARIPTLMDMDWGAINQAHELQRQQLEALKLKKQQDWKLKFEADIRRKAMAVNPVLSWNGTKLTFSSPGPATQQMGDEQLWDMYVTSAQSNGVTPDVKYFDEQIKPYYKQLAGQAFQNQLGALSLENIPQEKWDELYNENPHFKDYFMQNLQSETNPDVVEALKSMIPQDQGEGIWAKIKEDPFRTVGYGAIGAGASRAAWKKAKQLTAGSKYGGSVMKGVKGAAPFGLAMAAPWAAKQLGATDKEAQRIGQVANIGAGGIYGSRAAGNVLKGSLKGALGGAHLTKKELLQQAKNLGVNVKNASKVNKAAVRKLVTNQIDNLGYMASRRAITKKAGKAGLNVLMKNFIKKAGMKQAAGSAMPGWGNIAMGIMTVPDIIDLAKAMWSGEEDSGPSVQVPYTPGITMNINRGSYSPKSY